jgi:hypothetical protein
MSTLSATSLPQTKYRYVIVTGSVQLLNSKVEHLALSIIDGKAWVIFIKDGEKREIGIDGGKVISYEKGGRSISIDFEKTLLDIAVAHLNQMVKYLVAANAGKLNFMYSRQVTKQIRIFEETLAEFRKISQLEFDR